MRKCTINIKDKDYDIVLTRDSVKWLESKGFSIEDFDKRPITYFDILWQCGFLANHADVNPNLAEKLMKSYEDEGGDVTEVIRFLVEEYTNFINALADTNLNKKKKATITEI